MDRLTKKLSHEYEINKIKLSDINQIPNHGNPETLLTISSL